MVRRADEPTDPRWHQLLIKTLDRRLPIKADLAKEIHNYIVKYRETILNANKHDYLFITHMPEATQGQPISIAMYKKIIETVRIGAPDLYELTDHRIRHTGITIFQTIWTLLPNRQARKNESK